MTDTKYDRRESDPRINALITEVAAIQTRQDELTEQLAFNTQITTEVSKNTADIIEIFQALRAGIKVLGWIGAGMKWLTVVAGLVASFGAAWYAVTHWGQQMPTIDVPK